MSKDQTLGGLILLGSIVVLIVYAFLLSSNPMLAYGIVVTIAVVGLMAIVAWIGWTMATTPPPAPIESLDEVQTASTAPAEKPQEKTD